ncbi:hypothetical protein FSP39_011669 [Pinctada imbricata]|uniref:C1q domain-containing protein n=2 Tax=Pinctada imbricata TaxID=66713 RepID=A0AA88YUS9_PINIB|nr:hypothetical protein FSP39_011669 [Pinctada imbricata]
MDVRKDVGFLCSFTNHKVITANSQIKFDKVLRNDGHGYSAKTGIFTAPVEGLYQFYWSLLAAISKNIDINLIHEGKTITRNWIQHLSNHDSATCSNMVYLRVKKGETLFLQTTQSGGKLHSGAYCTFGGELIRY